MTAKQKACEAIARMPEGSTFEDIQYCLHVLESLARGERDLGDGKTLSQEQAERRLATLLSGPS